MLDTSQFVNELISQKYTHLCVVPCSFAKNLINAAVNMHKKLEYVPCASEAVACSIAAGLKMSGERPIVIVQSSGLTNMASCITSLLVPYDINFPIITSWRTYKDGDSEIQHKHLATKLPDLIHSYGYEFQILDQEKVETAIHQINQSENKKIISVLKKETFSEIRLDEQHKINLTHRIPRSRFLKSLNKSYKNSEHLFVGTTGNTAREMYSFMPDTHNFYMAGNMGGALSLGLGAAKAGKKVFVCGGDAEFVMHLGGITTAGRYKDEIDLTYILFDNESNKSTGGQDTQQGHVNYIELAKNSNFDCAEVVIDNLDIFNNYITEFNNHAGLNFMHVKCSYDKETPRPPIDAIKINYFSSFKN